MLAEDGPRVIDFGISRATEFGASDVLTLTGRDGGTARWSEVESGGRVPRPSCPRNSSPPPQDVGPAAGIFSLGSVVAYAATGHGPFGSPSPYETAVRVVDGTPELNSVPPDLLTFVHFCLEKHPKSRPTPDELLGLLRDGRIPEPRPPEPMKADKRASTRSRSAPAVPSTAVSPQARRWCARVTRPWRPGSPWPTAATPGPAPSTPPPTT
ncbi:hypothetical protein ACQF36_14055 [Streptomyces sp. Marseille-Q5077]|uniref:hypothetical protein n=1 Tax=Streptomyces sp. Marseille-Q5077 TaxID=3418995 RepID=UPI003D03085D